MIASTHRGHGHCGAMGNKHAKTEEARQEHWNKMMAELMGKATGYCKGRGGSMHIADVEKGNLGSTGIVGGNIPIGTGAALAEKLKGTDAVVLCYFGDGATNTGSFHEALNMGATLLCGLPIVYICENNLYGMSVPFHDRSIDVRGTGLQDRGYCRPRLGLRHAGRDRATAWTCSRSRRPSRRQSTSARKGDGPTLIECKTYRWYGHSSSDQRVYRTREEEAEWKERDPITVLAQEAARRRHRDRRPRSTRSRRRPSRPSRTPPSSRSTARIPTSASSTTTSTCRWTSRSLPPTSRPRRRCCRRSSEIEDEVRKIAGATLPKLKAAEVKAVEEKYGMPIKSYGQAIVDAQREEMKRDETRHHHGRGRRPLRRRLCGDHAASTTSSARAE